MVDGMKFQFRCPKIIFHRNACDDLPEICGKFGKIGMLIHGQSFKAKSGKFEQLLGAFNDHDLEVLAKSREGGEPTVLQVDEMANVARKNDVDWVLGVGGGSAIDLSKAVAALVTNDGPTSIYQEGSEFKSPSLPFIAVPTTAGTGAEITNNSVLINEEKAIKKSIRGDKMLARVAVLDPLLTRTIPPRITAYTGLDALTQAIEAHVSKASNALTDILAEKAMILIWNNLYRAWKDGSDLEARENMLYGSMLSALSFFNAKLGAVHGFAHPIGIQHHLPHGLVCGVLLPHVMKFNLEGKIPRVVEKFAWIGKQLEDKNRMGEKCEEEYARFSISKIFSLLEKLDVPKTISGIGLKEEDIPAIVKDTKGSSLANNPRETNKELLTGILKDAL